MKKTGILCSLLLTGTVLACSPVFIPDRYVVENGDVYYIHGRPEVKQLITGADAKSFSTKLEKYQSSQFYAEDARHVFFQGTALKGLNPARIRLSQLGYVADDNQVFFQGELVKGADGASFHRMPAYEQGSDYTQFYVDTNHIYHAGKILPGNAKTARFLGHFGYYSDADNIYYNGKILPEALPTDFKLLGDFIVSNGRVFKQDQHIKIDAKNFEVLEEVRGKKDLLCTPPPYLGTVLKNSHAVYALTHDGKLIPFRWWFSQNRAKKFLESLESKYHL